MRYHMQISNFEVKVFKKHLTFNYFIITNRLSEIMEYMDDTKGSGVAGDYCITFGLSDPGATMLGFNSVPSRRTWWSFSAL